MFYKNNKMKNKILILLLSMFCALNINAQQDTCLAVLNYQSSNCSGASPSQVVLNLRGEDGSLKDQLIADYDAAGNPIAPVTSTNGLILWDGTVNNGSYSNLNVVLNSGDKCVLDAKVIDNCAWGTQTGPTIGTAINSGQVIEQNYRDSVSISNDTTYFWTIIENGDGTETVISDGFDTDNSAEPSVSTVAGTDIFNNDYSIGDNIVTYPNGAVVCVPEKPILARTATADCYGVSGADPDLFKVDITGGLVGTPHSSVNTGSVSIGFDDCATDMYKFNVDGRIWLTDQKQNAIIGSNAGIVWTGTESVMVGVDAGQGKTTGLRHVFVGKSAGENSLGSVGNIAIGAYAAQGAGNLNRFVGVGYTALQNAQGADNIAIGYLNSSAAVGSFNTSIGNNAMRFMQGSQSVAIGYNSLVTPVGDATSSVGIGYNTLARVDGLRNVGIGAGSAVDLIGGSNLLLGAASGANAELEETVGLGTQSLFEAKRVINGVYAGTNSGFSTEDVNFIVGIGISAADKQKTSIGNTGVGTQTIQRAIDSDYNTAIGHQALLAITGSHNIAVGAFTNGATAMSSANNLTFTAANVNVGANTITITGHGYAVGDIINLTFPTGALPPPMVNSNVYEFEVIDANTLMLTLVTLTGTGTGGTGGLVNDFDNTIVIGNYSQALADDEVTIGANPATNGGGGVAPTKIYSETAELQTPFLVGGGTPVSDIGIDANGFFTISPSGAIPSDRRFKENIENISTSELLYQLEPVIYDKKISLGNKMVVTFNGKVIDTDDYKKEKKKFRVKEKNWEKKAERYTIDDIELLEEYEVIDSAVFSIPKNVKENSKRKEKIGKFKNEDSRPRFKYADVEISTEQITSTRKEFGLIAQDVEKIFPEMVHTDKEGYKHVMYNQLIPHLIKELSKEKSRNDDFEKRLEALEKQ